MTQLILSQNSNLMEQILVLRLEVSDETCDNPRIKILEIFAEAKEEVKGE